MQSSLPHIHFASSRFFPEVSLALFLGLGFLGNAQADTARLWPAQVPQSYLQECGACHIAYPPSLLPAASWRRIMTGLDKHYGTDASLDAATLAQLNAWLQREAGSRRPVDTPPPEDRISRSAWFVREHREIDPAVWRHASVKSAANCSACHSQAAQGDYSERNLRAPPGLDARLQRSFRD